MNKKVLIVEDDPTSVTFLERILTKNGFFVVSAENGKAALEKISADPPDIILSDIIMPEMDGFELFNCLLQSEESADIPFVFLSVVTDPREQLKGLRMGAGEYLTKPLNGKELLATIEKVMDKAEKFKAGTREVDFGGSLSQVGLSEVIQVLEINEKNGELVLARANREPIGHIYLRKGKIIHAVSGALEGEEAFYDLMHHHKGYFTFHSREISAPETISQQNMSLLFEASRLSDEAKAIYSRIKNPDATLRLKSSKIPETTDEHIDEAAQNKIVAMITAGRTVREILESGILSRLRTIGFLIELLKADAIAVNAAAEKPPEGRVSDETGGGEVPMLVRGNLVDKLREIDGTDFTGVIDIQGRSEQASIFISNGRIINAFHGNTTATKALFRIFSERGGSCSIRPADIDPALEIDAPLDHLFKEASREIAWRRRVKSDFSRIHVIPRREKMVADAMDKEMIRILELVRAHRQLKEIIDACPLSDFETCSLIEQMREQGIVAYEKAEG